MEMIQRREWMDWIKSCGKLVNPGKAYFLEPDGEVV